MFRASALLELGMESTDGTGATLAWPLVRSAAALLTEVAEGEDPGPSRPAGIDGCPRAGLPAAATAPERTRVSAAMCGLRLRRERRLEPAPEFGRGVRHAAATAAVSSARRQRCTAAAMRPAAARRGRGAALRTAAGRSPVAGGGSAGSSSVTCAPARRTPSARRAHARPAAPGRRRRRRRPRRPGRLAVDRDQRQPWRGAAPGAAPPRRAAKARRPARLRTARRVLARPASRRTGAPDRRATPLALRHQLACAGAAVGDAQAQRPEHRAGGHSGPDHECGKARTPCGDYHCSDCQPPPLPRR